MIIFNKISRLATHKLTTRMDVVGENTMKFNKILMIICCSAGIITTTNAAIVSTTGSVSHTTAPDSLDFGITESSDSIIAFSEQQNVILSSDLSVDYLTSTTSIGTIASGTRVSSYFLHFDPIGDALSEAARERLAGSLTLNEQIIGLIYSGVYCSTCPATPEYIDASDHLGATGTFYPTGGMGRGLELDSDPYYTGRGDIFNLSADGLTLDIEFAVYPVALDQLRIITVSAVPVPAGIYLLFSGIMALGFFRKKINT